VPADLVLVNGKVVTMDGAGTIAEAVAVIGERICRVGTRGDVEPLVGDRTTRVDLEGRVVVPGFIDTHVHLDCAATHTKLATSFHLPPVDYVEVSGSVSSRDTILACIEKKARETPKGEWIIGQGRFSMESDGNSPTRRELDRVAPDHPVMIRYSAHSQLLNGKALGLVGIGRDTPSRAELDDVAPGARILRDPSSGEPTGVIHEGIDWILRMRNPWSHEELKGAIRKTCQEAVRFGVTSIHEFVSWPESARIYQELHRSGELPLRVQLCPCVWGMYHTVEIDSLVRLGIQTGFGNDWIKFGSAKIFVDGEGRDEEGVYREWPRITQEKLDELVGAAHEAGIRVMMHATSRRGQGMAIRAVEAALKEAPRRDHRHRIEHFAGDHWPAGLERLKALGIIPVPTPYSSLGWFGDDWLEISRPGEKVVPYRTLLDEGFMPPGNSDCMGTEPEALNPWWSIWCVVARKTRSGRSICPEEGLGVLEAIRLYTTHSAYAGFEEDTKGSIEAGKLADLVALSEDPFEIPVDRLKDVRVALTVIGGEVAYANGIGTTACR
jgi:predicted amidohydrolase YtcJ